MLPLGQGDFGYVTLWIPLILGVKVLHIIITIANHLYIKLLLSQ